MEPPRDPDMLPGFDPERADTGDSGLSAAALATISALEEAGLLTGRHALTAQLLVAASKRAGMGLQEHKTTIATTNLLRLLVELLDKLPTADGAVSSEAEAFLKALAEAEAQARA